MARLSWISPGSYLWSKIICETLRSTRTQCALCLAIGFICKRNAAGKSWPMPNTFATLSQRYGQSKSHVLFSFYKKVTTFSASKVQQGFTGQRGNNLWSFDTTAQAGKWRMWLWRIESKIKRLVQAVAGLGFRISLPVSSQSIAKSHRTSRVLCTKIKKNL